MLPKSCIEFIKMGFKREREKVTFIVNMFKILGFLHKIYVLHTINYVYIHILYIASFYYVHNFYIWNRQWALCTGKVLRFYGTCK